MTIISIDRLNKTFPTQAAPVLSGVSFDVRSGELVALLGPSGSGKSTILKIIAGIEQPDSGDVRFDERTVAAVPSQERGAVLMFQKAYLFPFLNVADNIAFGLKMRRVPKTQIRSEVARMLELVELPGIERKFPDQLSGGQQQRVALARALVVHPRVLLLDEPFNGLDTAIRQTLQDTVRRIQRELRTTTILVTHDLQMAIAMSDQTAVLLGGRIVAFDRPERVFQRPPTIAAARFMGVSTFITGRVEGDRLHAPWGTLRVALGTQNRDDMTYAIRPEHVLLHSTPSPNTLSGTIMAATYNGEYIAYRVAIGPMQVDVKVFGTEQYPVGSSVFAEFRTEHLFAVDES